MYGDATLENNEIIFNGNLFVYFTSSLHRSKMTMRREWKKMKSFCVFVCCKRISFFEKEKKMMIFHRFMINHTQCQG